VLILERLALAVLRGGEAHEHERRHRLVIVKRPRLGVVVVVAVILVGLGTAVSQRWTVERASPASAIARIDRPCRCNSCTS
jgi:predicted transporter